MDGSIVLFYTLIIVWLAIHGAHGAGKGGTWKYYFSQLVVGGGMLSIEYFHGKDGLQIIGTVIVLLIIAALGYALGRTFVTPPQKI